MNAVDPDHYRDYVKEMQWIEVMSMIPTLKKPERFIAAIELQIRKYLDRNGQKDVTILELRKSLFYLVFLIKYIENKNTVVSAKKIHKLISKI